MEPMEFQQQLSLMLAKYYAEAISKNVKRSIERKLRDGKWVHKAPLGYKKVLSNNAMTIEVDPEQAPFVVKAFRLHLKGLSCKAIAKQLAEEGLRSTNGTIVTVSSIDRLIRNPFYCGFMEYDGRQYPHKYQPLIRRHMFYRCCVVNRKKNQQDRGGN